MRGKAKKVSKSLENDRCRTAAERSKKETVKEEEHQKKEIKESIEKQQKNVAEEKIKKEERLEELLEGAEKIKKESNISEEDMRHIYGISFELKKQDYEYKSSYLGRKENSAYDKLNSGRTDDLAESTAVKEVMAAKEQREYALKQAANFLVGTNVNHISHDEKEKFSALMTLPSNKIIFLINYALTGMNYVMPQPITQSRSSQSYEIKLTNSEIKEKSMKNDIMISLRFDVKSSSQKSYVK
jgi:hypothetical protein